MPFPEVIDNTMRKAFAVCPTKFRREFVDCLTPIGDKSIHLHFGACFATGLETARKWYFGDEPLSHQAAVEAGVNDAVAAYGIADAQGTLKTVDRLIGALNYYFRTWPMYEEKLVPVVGGIECTFAIPLPLLHPVTGKNLLYVGRYDVLARDEEAQNRLVVVDEKTAGRLGDMADAKWDLDCQLTGYIWSVREQLRRGEREMPLPSVNDIRGLVRTVSILKSEFGHMETNVVRSAWYIDRWYGQLCRDVQRAIDSFNAGLWDMALHENACVQFGRKCEYNPLCLTPHPERIVDGLYTLRVWNPLTKGE